MLQAARTTMIKPMKSLWPIDANEDMAEDPLKCAERPIVVGSKKLTAARASVSDSFSKQTLAGEQLDRVFAWISRDTVSQFFL